MVKANGNSNKNLIDKNKAYRENIQLLRIMKGT